MEIFQTKIIIPHWNVELANGNKVTVILWFHDAFFHVSEFCTKSRMLQRERERERERESFNCILSLVPYPPKNVSHMLLTLFFFGCCLPHFVDAESDAKCSMGYHTLPSIPRKFQTWSEVFFPGVFFLFWVGFCLPEFEWLGKGQKKKKQEWWRSKRVILGYPLQVRCKCREWAMLDRTGQCPIGLGEVVRLLTVLLKSWVVRKPHSSRSLLGGCSICQHCGCFVELVKIVFFFFFRVCVCVCVFVLFCFFGGFFFPSK